MRVASGSDDGEVVVWDVVSNLWRGITIGLPFSHSYEIHYNLLESIFYSYSRVSFAFKYSAVPPSHLPLEYKILMNVV